MWCTHICVQTCVHWRVCVWMCAVHACVCTCAPVDERVQSVNVGSAGACARVCERQYSGLLHPCPGFENRPRHLLINISGEPGNGPRELVGRTGCRDGAVVRAGLRSQQGRGAQQATDSTGTLRGGSRGGRRGPGERRLAWASGPGRPGVNRRAPSSGASGGRTLPTHTPPALHPWTRGPRAERTHYSLLALLGLPLHLLEPIHRLVKIEHCRPGRRGHHERERQTVTGPPGTHWGPPGLNLPICQRGQ